MADWCQKTARKRAAGTGSSVASTQTSRFIPPADQGSTGFGYSDSGFQFVRLTALLARHHRHLAGDLRVAQLGSIDLLAGL
jgi:hypothetical protein